MFTNNPLRAKLREGETDQSVMKITIKDMPLSKGNKGIEQYLITQGLKLRGKIEYAKARNENNELTDWLNGDRMIFVENLKNHCHEEPGLVILVFEYFTGINLPTTACTALTAIRMVTTKSNVKVIHAVLFARLKITPLVRGHGGRVVTLSPPTSAAGVRSPSWP